MKLVKLSLIALAFTASAYAAYKCTYCNGTGWDKQNNRCYFCKGTGST
jgi:DnaJ-class molecular chaperone